MPTAPVGRRFCVECFVLNVLRGAFYEHIAKTFCYKQELHIVT